MRRSLLGLLGAFLALSSIQGPTAQAQDGGDAPVLYRIANEGKLRVGMSGNQPPLNVKSKSGELIGLEVDLAQLLARAMGVELVPVMKPFGDLLGALEKGEVDLVMSGMTMTPARNMRAAFVGPYFVSGKSILTKAENLANRDETDEINASGVTLAALEGSTSQRFVEMLIPKAKLETTKDYDTAVQLVIDGKVDAFVADHPICVLSVLRFPEANLATLATPLTVEPIGIALPPQDPLFVNLIQNYLGALQGTGEFDALRAKWLEDGSWVSQLP